MSLKSCLEPGFDSEDEAPIEFESFFVPKNLIQSFPAVPLEEDDRFAMQVTEFQISAENWYKKDTAFRMQVIRVETNEVIYSADWYWECPMRYLGQGWWIHFLSCHGGQTHPIFIYLETGQIRDTRTMPEWNNAQFIWCGQQLSPNGKYIYVEGCVWAAPYEVLIYDFETLSVLKMDGYMCLVDDMPNLEYELEYDWIANYPDGRLEFQGEVYDDPDIFVFRVVIEDEGKASRHLKTQIFQPEGLLRLKQLVEYISPEYQEAWDAMNRQAVQMN